MGGVGTVEELFVREYARLVRALGTAFEPEAAADAVQEAFIEADRRLRRISTYDDPAAWVRRVALNRLLTARRTHLRRAEILATIRPVGPEDLTPDQLDLRVHAEGGFPGRVDHREWISVAVTHGACPDLAPVEPAVLEGSQLRIRTIADLAPDEAAAVVDRPCISFPARLRTDVVAVRRDGLPEEVEVVFMPQGGSGFGTTVTIPEVPPLLASDGSGPEGEVRAVRPSPPRRMGEIELVESATQLRERWSTLGLGPVQTVPEVDFDRDAVVLLTTTTGACPPVLTGFDAGASGLTARLVPGEGECGAQIRTHTVVVALARADLAGGRTIRLPGDEVLGFEPSSLALTGP